MKADLVRVTACSLGLMLLPALAPAVWAQSDGAPPLQAQSSNQSPQQLDQLLAPIALYPDPLLAQILMASTYPLDVVEAARWLDDRNNARLRGDQLDAALQQQPWDPSVKSLVPFPQILQMMNSKLDWTQALGNAFLAQQADVAASVQRLRAQAMAAGSLQSTPQETVSSQGPIIVIEPASPEIVYVPYYDPRRVYGRWDTPDYPPIYFPPPPNYGYVAGPVISFGVGFGVIGALWGWDRWDWGHHNIHIDADRYNRINRDAISHNTRPAYSSDTWQHDPAHRRGVPYGNSAVRQQYQPNAARPDTHHDFRGFDKPAPSASFAVPHTAAPQPQIAPQARPPAQHPVAPAFSSFGHGPDVRAQSQRGQTSRQSAPPPHVTAAPPTHAVITPQRSAPPSPQPQHAAPANHGPQGGEHDKPRH